MHYLSVALTIKTKWFDSLKEWFLWNKFIGVDHFYIVDDNNERPLRRLFANFSDDITFIDEIDPDICMPQKEMFDIIYNKHRDESHWFAFIDDDEYIMSLQDVEFIDFLKYFEHKKSVELTARFFGPHGYTQHEGLEAHKHSLILDRYWLYESKPLVKSIVNSKLVSSFDEASGSNIHRLATDQAVNCFGHDIEPLDETIMPSWAEVKLSNNRGRIHNPSYVINHYGLKSLQEIEYKLFERGFVQGERVSKDPLTYRNHKLLLKLFSTTYSINPHHKGNFNNFHFHTILPDVRKRFKQYFDFYIQKFA